jgi:ATP-binding cassette subfamily F protein 3
VTALLQCHRLSHSAGTKSLFKRLDLTINTGDRIGLVGHNGSGKSTLLSILDGNLEPDDGDISRNNGLQLETVEQFIDPRLNSLNLFAALSEKLPDEIRTASQYKADQLLAQLGFEETEYEFLVSDLSGGQQNRLMFARAVINEPNLILFDEPTNHLDLKTLLLFEEFLKNLRAAFLIISHDREFLDAVTTRTVFLRDERLYYYSQPFSRARQALDEFDTASEAAREVEEKNIKRLAASAHRLAVWGRVYDNEKIARKAKNMEKRVERLKDERTFVTQGSGLNLTLDVGSAHANRMLHIEGQMIHAPGGPGEKEPLFFIEDFMIRPGERVALLGHNGTGKTTLINLIMEHYQVDKDGDLVKFNPQCQIGYYDQELALLNPAHSMTETLRDRCGGADNTLKSALIKAGFPYLDLDKKVAVLSGGEKARLMFLIIKLNQPNFLILDEPTNHIDIQGKEELEVQILETNATVLITSHDRRFVDQIADRFLLIDNQQLREINDPQAFYRQTKRTRQATGADVPTGEEKQHSRAEDDILARIVELETLLEQDLARKPKFQKLKLQVSWQEEIDTLNKLL